MFSGLLSTTNNEQPGHENNSGLLLDMGLLSVAVDKILSFNTQKEAFNKNYPKNDHVQKSYHEKALNHLIGAITTKFNANNRQPISILDLCCGYGGPTFTLRQRLIQNGVEIAKIVGYDVSEDMIEFARQKNIYFPQMEFEKKNVETEFTELQPMMLWSAFSEYIGSMTLTISSLQFIVP